jgi:HEAT repeat protein
MKKKSLIGLVLLAAASAFVVFLEPTKTIVGYLRGEPSYHGRYAGYWRSALMDANPAVHSQAQEDLTRGGGEAVPVLIDLFKSVSDASAGATTVRLTAADLLGRIGAGAAPATPALIAGLHDADRHIRLVATKALGEIGPGAKDAASALSLLLASDKDPVIRWNAARSLGLIGPEAQATVGILIDSGLRDEEADVREHSAESLGQIQTHDPTAIAALIRALKDPSERVRRDAVRSLGQIGPAAGDALPAVKALEKDESERVRQAAGQALKQITK